VDIMEFLEMGMGGAPSGVNPDKLKELEDIFTLWKSCEVFKRRVVAILIEEGRGRATLSAYRAVVKLLRKTFKMQDDKELRLEHSCHACLSDFVSDAEYCHRCGCKRRHETCVDRYRILCHAHGGHGLEDAAALEILNQGGEGCWSALIPQAAQAGHNCWAVFLDNLLNEGNQHVGKLFDMSRLMQCARHCYYLNFNTYDVTGDCPIWGGRSQAVLHTAFKVESGDDWKRRALNEYNEFPEEVQKSLQATREKRTKEEQNYKPPKEDVPDNYRISPLVSDPGTWTSRLLTDCALITRAEANDVMPCVRKLGFALMNANIRLDMNSKAGLKKLVDIAKHHQMWKAKRGTDPGAPLNWKAADHQGKGQ